MSDKSENDRSYYCSHKFRSLKIDLTAMTTLNCHAAATHPVDFDWLSKNPGQLFNNERSVDERRMMLLNQRNSSCEQNCWPAEDRGAVSTRMHGGIEKTHTQIISQPESIDITIGSDCNLTCSYCCREYSSAWKKDLADNGDYLMVGNDNRYTLTLSDQILSKLSQPEVKKSKNYNILLNEVKLAAPHLKKLVVSGGEPLLDNQLVTTITELKLQSTAFVKLYTGLGMSRSRFLKMVEKLKLIPNLILCVSAESMGKNFEFNRYGNKWDETLEKINILKNNNINMQFHVTLSNLTLMGFVEFYKYFSDCHIHVTFVNNPTMMSVHVLDNDTKEQIKNSLKSLPDRVSATILTSMQAEPTEEEKTYLKQFLTQFIKRRPDLSMDIYPASFVNWVGINNVV
jgi:MoaA/NifB/PqqE/SkfB family radical SAM enzyme